MTEATVTRPSMTSSSNHPISWRARGFRLLLRLMKRRRIYESAAGLMASIEDVRRVGPALPPQRLFTVLDVESEKVGSCPVYTLRPLDAPQGGKNILYLHGGAYCRPITRQHWSLLEWLVKDLGCTVMVPLYPLAPESECLATLRLVRKVRDLLLRRHGPIDAFMGDSAGGGLCLALCQDLRDAGQALPKRLTLITPWVDVTLTHPDIPATLPRDPMLALDGLREAGRLYAGKLGVEHPLVSPLRADLRGMPAMQLLAGTDDILHHDAVRYAEQAAKAGCSVELELGHGMMHVWPLFPLPEANRSRQAISEFLRR
ncbi:alpha/beta hydrolase fold domain-containing protein [Roseateles cellulosilyticus]|uniref:Alpha/beta hydrolase n=1 Tax=Pelomonas cellulosilytica TaxID=2906762 RepID=A0ABS8XW02_9BURK|nr:alpha/beta hydrolase [Pelomonas sp. P8]MCE4556834.1 alpha/beta hydrolase [Pelomonas sp. P8]